jgi:hypothetical protein
MLQLSLLMEQQYKSKSTRPLLLARVANKTAVSALFALPESSSSLSLVTRLLPVKALASIGEPVGIAGAVFDFTVFKRDAQIGDICC